MIVPKDYNYTSVSGEHFPDLAKGTSKVHVLKLEDYLLNPDQVTAAEWECDDEDVFISDELLTETSTQAKITVPCVGAFTIRIKLFIDETLPDLKVKAITRILKVY